MSEIRANQMQHKCRRRAESVRELEEKKESDLNRLANERIESLTDRMRSRRAESQVSFAKSIRRLEYLDPLGRMGEGKTERAPGPIYLTNRSTLDTKGISRVGTKNLSSLSIVADQQHFIPGVGTYQVTGMKADRRPMRQPKQERADD